MKPLVSSLLLLLSLSVNSQEIDNTILFEKEEEVEVSDESLTGLEDDSEILFVQHIPVTIDKWQMLVQSRNKDYPAIEDYIIYNHSVNKPVINGNSLLHLSAMQDNPLLATIGMTYKANIFIKNNKNETPLHWAAASNDLTILKILVPNLNININSVLTKNMQTPLHYNVLLSKNVNVTNYILSFKQDVNLKDINGETALHYSVLFNKWDMAKALLAKGADINIKDKDGLSVEDYALTHANVEGLEILYPYLSEKGQKEVRLRLRP